MRNGMRLLESTKCSESAQVLRMPLFELTNGSESASLGFDLGVTEAWHRSSDVDIGRLLVVCEGKDDIDFF